MTRKLLTVVVLGLSALVLQVAPALALSKPPEVTSSTSAQRGSAEPVDFWNYESGRKVADSSPGVSPEGLANLYGQAAESEVAVTTSTRDIEWPQLGIGLGLGIALAFGLGLAMRLGHVRPFAH